MRYLSLLLFFVSIEIVAQSSYDSLWDDPAVENRIREGIETHRKGDLTLKLTDKQGKPIQKATVEIRQDNHAFLFGANIFMLDGYPDEAMNRKYEHAFTKIFNYASVPFYWKDIEPTPGNYRFGVDSPPIFRRPPPDKVIAFCKKNNIRMKGHTLIWDSPVASTPSWAPRDPDSLAHLLKNRIKVIGERYKDDIEFWDVANETFLRHPENPMPKDYVYLGFKESEKYFNSDNQLIYNEVPETFLTKNFRGEYSYLYVFMESLLLRGAKVGGIGLQFHLFPHLVDPAAVYAGTTNEFSPGAVLRVLDQLAQFNLPLNISEITFPVLVDSDEGRRKQAQVTRNFYRLFFSHPAMQAITWWNMPDGKAWGNEGRLKPGLVDEELNPKPSYAALDDLINKEWKTNLTIPAQAGKPVTFRGFYGDYTVKVTVGKKTIEKKFTLAQGQPNTLQVEF
jgi:endo-1,4-beta-xylanase